MSLSANDYRYVRDLVYRQAAIVLDHDKEYLISSRLENVARDRGLGSASEVVARAQQGGKEVQVAVVEAITTHETSFFRDMHAFEALRLAALPPLIAARAERRKLDIWCAACSSGQEPYSIAMLWNEHFAALSGWTLRILATDISTRIVASAQAACFRQMDVNRGLPARMLTRHFAREGLNWRLAPAIRDQVEFRQLNLLQEWRLPRTPDIVFLRNVLIYFDVATRRRILDRIYTLLPADGVLFLGAAETTLGIDDRWERAAHGTAVYFRKKP